LLTPIDYRLESSTPIMETTYTWCPYIKKERDWHARVRKQFHLTWNDALDDWRSNLSSRLRNFGTSLFRNRTIFVVGVAISLTRSSNAARIPESAENSFILVVILSRHRVNISE